MKHITSLALLSIACLSTCVGAAAQGMKANIPFDFTVGNTKLPAGQYRISSPVDQVIRLQSADNASVATVVSLQSWQEPGTTNELVFRKYGDRYFLHSVLSRSSSRMNLDIAPGKAEKEARTAEAKLHTGHEVLVAAR